MAQSGHRVIGVDSNGCKVKLINEGKATIIEHDIDVIIKAQRSLGRVSATTDPNSAILETDVSVIAVGTPSSPNGHLDLSYVTTVSEQIALAISQKDTFHAIFIRSTVSPGTNERVTRMIEERSGKKRGEGFAVISNPEFLREGTAVYDYYHPPFTIVGTTSPQAAEIARELYRKVSAEFIVVGPTVAEMIKYVSNSFHALKVTFANEVGNICKALGVDSQEVMEVFVKDRHLNISSYYLRPGFAYGGSCLPKDLAGLRALAHDNYLDAPVIESVCRSNEVQIKRAIDLIASFGKKNIGFIGLSFKSGTDDLRNSPSVTVVETLLGKGYHVVVYDKDVALTKLTGTNWSYIQEHLPHLSALLVSSMDEAIAASDIIVLATGVQGVEWDASSLDGKPLIDLTGAWKTIVRTGSYTGLSW